MSNLFPFLNTNNHPNPLYPPPPVRTTANFTNSAGNPNPLYPPTTMNTRTTMKTKQSQKGCKSMSD